MADYYQLIARAVAGLPQNTPETRKAIYDRARRALTNQLRSIQPPVPEADIQRESKSLEEAVARLEIECAAAPIPQIPALPVQSPPPPASPPVFIAAPPVNPPVKSTPPNITPPNTSEPRPEPFRAPELKAPVAPIVIPATLASAEATSTIDELAKIHTPTPTETIESNPQTSPGTARSKGEAVRPIAPTAIESRKPAARLWIMGAAALLLVASVAGAALWLKQNADDPARKLKQEAAINGETKPANGKIAERVAGMAPPPPVTNIIPAKPASAPPSAATAPETPVAANSPPAAAQTIAVATRAALLIEAPEEPTKVKTYVGTIVWTNTTKSGTNGPMTIMHGEASIPDAQLKFSFNLQQNDDATFPASHVLNLRFMPETGSKLTAIKELHIPEMRSDEASHGEPLRGAAVAITSNDYMVGLSRVDRDKARNIDLLTQRGWFDLPILLADGREAKLTLEKGIPGDKALSEALK